MSDDRVVISSKPEAEAVESIVRRSLEPRTIDVGGRLVLVTPSGLTAQSVKPILDEYLTAPERRKGTANFSDLESFIAHANRFKDAGSVLFADRDEPSLTCVLDYHPPGSTSPARFGEHRGVYTFPVSDEWTAWTAKNKQAMSQADFAEWLENHITEIADPAVAGESAKALVVLLGCQLASPSTLLQLSRGLTARTSSKVQNATNLATGEVAMQFVTTQSDETGQPLKVPGAFLVALPVFRNGALYQLAARLRYRIRDATVTWFFELHQHERIFDHAFNEAGAKAEGGTQLPIYTGSPEE